MVKDLLKGDFSMPLAIAITGPGGPEAMKAVELPAIDPGQVDIAKAKLAHLQSEMLLK